MIPSYQLNDGSPFPAIGLGTYALEGPSGVEAIAQALQAGYRLLDSAVNYENEGAIGQAVRRSGIPREEVLITSKLPGRHHGYAEAITCAHESLYRMGVDYLDLFLIHWPNPLADRYVEAWQALVDLQRDGLLRSIGVSNFLPEHLNRIIAQTGVTPSVNQIELHPYWPQPQQLEVHAQLGIRTESWSPLARGTSLRQDPVILRLADTYDRTPSQIVLRWHIQLGTVPLPKSASPGRQQENLDLFDFELDPDAMAAISGLARAEGRITGADPASHEEF